MGAQTQQNSFKYTTYFYFDNGLKIKVEKDILRYYLWHLYRSKHDTIGFKPPMYDGHISITLPRIHGIGVVEKSRIYDGKMVDIIISNQLKFGGSWFRNCWLPIECPKADEIKKELGIHENSLTRLIFHYITFGLIKKPYKFLGYHLTIANTKAFVVEQNSKAKELSEKMNRGDYSIDEFRQKMKDLNNE